LISGLQITTIKHRILLKLALNDPLLFLSRQSPSLGLNYTTCGTKGLTPCTKAGVICSLL
jgi:hypothetical protein